MCFVRWQERVPTEPMLNIVPEHGVMVRNSHSSADLGEGSLELGLGYGL